MLHNSILGHTILVNLIEFDKEESINIWAESLNSHKLLHWIAV